MITQSKSFFERYGVKPSQVAKALGVTRSAVSQWRRVPISRLRQIERAFGIPRADLRPDIFGDDA